MVALRIGFLVLVALMVNGSVANNSQVMLGYEAKSSDRAESEMLRMVVSGIQQPYRGLMEEYLGQLSMPPGSPKRRFYVETVPDIDCPMIMSVNLGLEDPHDVILRMRSDVWRDLRDGSQSSISVAEMCLVHELRHIQDRMEIPELYEPQYRLAELFEGFVGQQHVTLTDADFDLVVDGMACKLICELRAVNQEFLYYADFPNPDYVNWTKSDPNGEKMQLAYNYWKQGDLESFIYYVFDVYEEEIMQGNYAHEVNLFDLVQQRALQHSLTPKLHPRPDAAPFFE